MTTLPVLPTSAKFPQPPAVRLVSCTLDPIGTIAAAWNASRHNDTVALPLEHPHAIGGGDDAFAIFKKVIDSKIPVAEMVDFVFLLENVSIEWREQAVRHRIGVKVDGRLGADLVPDLADSTWWSQSMRILDMSAFFRDGRYRMPETVRGNQTPCLDPHGNTTTVQDLWLQTMAWDAKAYAALAAAGVPLEDARGVVPLAATHRITWKLNLASLMHIIGKRGCWILQLGLWEPVIRGMVDELATKIHPYFRNLIAPPCIKSDKFTGCLFKLDNERRIAGEDEIPPCPLYLHHHKEEAMTFSFNERDAGRPTAWAPQWASGDWRTGDVSRAQRMERMEKQYESLWERNIHTGQPLKELA